MERRFFVEKIGQQAILAGDEFSHAKNVLRLGVGDELVLFDGGGKEYTAVVASVGKREMVCSVLDFGDSHVGDFQEDFLRNLYLRLL